MEVKLLTSIFVDPLETFRGQSMLSLAVNVIGQLSRPLDVQNGTFVCQSLESQTAGGTRGTEEMKIGIVRRHWMNSGLALDDQIQDECSLLRRYLHPSWQSFNETEISSIRDIRGSPQGRRGKASRMSTIVVSPIPGSMVDDLFPILNLIE